MNAKFFSLLRYSIDETLPPPEDIVPADYQALYRMSAEQALLGVMFNGVSRMPENRRPGRELAMKWYSVSRQIASINMAVNDNAVKVTGMFQRHGFRSCVLKGQGNALLYPDPYTRMPGDIDIWVEGGTRKVLGIVNKLAPGTKHCYHHADFTPCGETSVEVHYRPSFMNNPFANRRLQRFFDDNADSQFANKTTLPDDAGEVSVPTTAFNRIFQMSHISNHFFNEGIGLRQFLDYYYVLKQGLTEAERVETGRILKACGLYKIASAVMYVEREVFGLDSRFLVVPVDECRGKFLLNEIMLSGNFGIYDERIKKYRGSQFEKNVQRIIRDVRLAWLFPSECLWEPPFRLYHFFWRVLHK